MSLNIRIHRGITGEVWVGGGGRPSPNLLVFTLRIYIVVIIPMILLPANRC
jgi:hypothetical protein